MYSDKSYAHTNIHAHTPFHEEIHTLDQTFTTYDPRAACVSLMLTVTTSGDKIDF